MIVLNITMTGKGYAPSSQWSLFHEEQKAFADIPAAMAWLKEQYGTSKRAPMYRDKADGKPTRIGYVIGFRNSDLSHYPVQHWLQQDWIEFRECNPVDLDVVRGEGK